MASNYRNDPELSRIGFKTRALLDQALLMLRQALTDERIASDEAAAVLATIEHELGLREDPPDAQPTQPVALWLERLGIDRLGRTLPYPKPFADRARSRLQSLTSAKKLRGC